MMIDIVKASLYSLEYNSLDLDYIPFVSTVSGATRIISATTLGVASIALTAFHILRAGYYQITGNTQRRYEQLTMTKDSGMAFLQSLGIIMRATIALFPIVGNVIVYQIDCVRFRIQQQAMLQTLNNNINDVLTALYQRQYLARQRLNQIHIGHRDYRLGLRLHT